MYRFEITRRAQHELDNIHSKELERIIVALKNLRVNPRPKNCKKLRRTIYRVRQGNWRIVYAVFDKEKLVIIGKIARRSESTYDGLDYLF